MKYESEQQALVATARLLGRLLLREVDGKLRDELLQPEITSPLKEFGFEVGVLREKGSLDNLAVEYFEEMVHPQQGGPLVQSLWTTGTYESDSAVAVRKLAEAVGAVFDPQAARGAAQDHLGSLLLLWAETRIRLPEVADRLEQEHLAWALPALARLGERPGFYGQLGRLVEKFVGGILATSGSPSGE